MAKKITSSTVAIKVTWTRELMPGLFDKLKSIPSASRAEYIRQLAWEAFRVEEARLAKLETVRIPVVPTTAAPGNGVPPAPHSSSDSLQRSLDHLAAVGLEV
jgi:hypothetical protein